MSITVFIAWLAMIAKELAARFGILAVLLGMLVACVVLVQGIIEGFLGLVPYTGVSGDTLSAVGALLPDNFKQCISLIFQAQLAMMAFKMKWLYMTMYMSAMKWKFI